MTSRPCARKVESYRKKNMINDDQELREMMMMMIMMMMMMMIKMMIMMMMMFRSYESPALLPGLRAA